MSHFAFLAQRVYLHICAEERKHHIELAEAKLMGKQKEKICTPIESTNGAKELEEAEKSVAESLFDTEDAKALAQLAEVEAKIKAEIAACPGHTEKDLLEAKLAELLAQKAKANAVEAESDLRYSLTLMEEARSPHKHGKHGDDISNEVSPQA